MKGQQAIGTLVIFIALVITAALASFVLVSTTNALQSKSLAVAGKTMEKATMGFASRAVEGLTTADDGNIEYVTIQIELAPGSDTIDLDDVTVIFQAAGGTKYAEFDVNTDVNNLDLNASALTSLTGVFTQDISTAQQAFVVNNRSDWDQDRYVESGEVYTLVLPIIGKGITLDEGEDWKIIIRAPYTQDLIVTGYAPEVLQKGQIVTLKAA